MKKIPVKTEQYCDGRSGYSSETITYIEVPDYVQQLRCPHGRYYGQLCPHCMELYGPPPEPCQTTINERKEEKKMENRIIVGEIKKVENGYIIKKPYVLGRSEVVFTTLVEVLKFIAIADLQIIPRTAQEKQFVEDLQMAIEKLTLVKQL